MGYAWARLSVLPMLWAAAGCSGARQTQPAEPPAGTADLTLTSQAFAAGGAIPVDCSCDGQDRSPPLRWSAPPGSTRSFALLVSDPDAPGGEFTHWVLYDLPPTTRRLPAGETPAGVEGRNDFGRSGYDGPCPPPGVPHHYRFTIYAIDVATVGLPAGSRRSEFAAQLSGHVLAQGTLIGTFSR